MSLRWASRSAFHNISVWLRGLIRPGWIVVVVILGLPFVLFWPLTVGGKVLFWGTPILQFYEWRLLVVDAYRAGRFPLWNSALGCGAPLLANLQSAALYPPNLIYFLFPVERAMGYSVVLHVVLAGCFMYGFTRHLGLTRPGALVASLAYMFGGFIIGRVQFLSMVNAAAWLPLLLWLTNRVMRYARLTDGLALGLTVAVQLLAGHAQLWYYSLWMMGLYGLFLGLGPLLCAWRRLLFGHRRDVGAAPAERPATGGMETVMPPSTKVTWTGWALLMLAVVVGVLAAAGQALPAAELARSSQRAAGLDYDFAMNYSFWPWRLLTLFAPDFFGNPAHGNFWGRGNYWEDCAYIGMLPLVLALIAVAAWLRRSGASAGPSPQATGLAYGRGVDPMGQAPFFALLSVAAVLLALGDNLPLYPWVWRHVPGFGAFQAPARLMYWYACGMAVLAGIGFDRLGVSEKWARFSRYLMAIAGSVLLTAGLGLVFLSRVTELTFLDALIRAATLAGVSGVLILLNTRWRTGAYRRAWTALSVGFVAVDLLIFGWPLTPSADPSVYHWPTDSGHFLRQTMGSETQTSRIFSYRDFTHNAMFQGFFRFKDFGANHEARLKALREMLLPNLAVIEGLMSANNYDPLVVGAQQNLLDRADTAAGPAALELLGLMGVRYIVGDQPSVEARLVYSGTVAIFENPRFLPRVYITKSTPQVEPLMAPAVYESAPLRDEQNRVTIDVELYEPAQLVLADTYYPGWHVTIDGEEHEILRVHHAFRAVELSVGRHQVVFAYAPASFWLGLYVSAATWFVALVWWVFLARKRISAHNLSDEVSSKQT